MKDRIFEDEVNNRSCEGVGSENIGILAPFIWKEKFLQDDVRWGEFEGFLPLL